MQDDTRISNLRFAKLTGLDVKDVHKLELTILHLFNYQIAPNEVKSAPNEVKSSPNVSRNKL